jgi:hypothetical protein
VADQQRMVTLPRHLILPSHLSGVVITLYLILYSCLWDYDDVNFAICFITSVDPTLYHYLCHVYLVQNFWNMMMMIITSFTEDKDEIKLYLNRMIWFCSNLGFITIANLFYSFERHKLQSICILLSNEEYYNWLTTRITIYAIHICRLIFIGLKAHGHRFSRIFFYCL